jgi:hypothetical protein
MGLPMAPQRTEAYKALESEHKARAALIPDNYNRARGRAKRALAAYKQRLATLGPRIKTERRVLDGTQKQRDGYTFDGGPRRPAYWTGQTVFGVAEWFMASQVVEKLFDLVGAAQYLVAGGLSAIIASLAHFTAHVIEEMLSGADTGDPTQRKARQVAAVAYLVLVAVLIALQGYVRAEDLADLQGPTGGNVPVSAGFLVAVQSSIFAMAFNLARRRVRGKPVRELDDQIAKQKREIRQDTAMVDADRTAIPEITQLLTSFDQREEGDREAEAQLFAQLCGTFRMDYEKGYKIERLGGTLLRRVLRLLFPKLLGVDRSQIHQLHDEPDQDERREEDVA